MAELARYLQWSDLQQELLRAHRGRAHPPAFAGFRDDEVGHALGWW